ncbi:putative DNA polymerase subunit alpha [Burkholderia contaminans]|nr:putative DNA polymerase subunit alpha [Burkholderia contaminans]
MMLEDETGQVNVILWPSLPETFRREALGAAVLAVYGVWQAGGKVRHLVASKLVDRTGGCQDFRVLGGWNNYTEGRTNRSA